MFRFVCDPSSGRVELYLTEIRSGSLMFVVCLVGVWQRNFETAVCMYGMAGWARRTVHAHALVGIDLLILHVSKSHSDMPHSVGLLWTSFRLVAENFTWHHTTFTTDRHPCTRRCSKPHSQQASGRRPTPSTAPPLRST